MKRVRYYLGYGLFWWFAIGSVGGLIYYYINADSMIEFAYTSIAPIMLILAGYGLKALIVPKVS